MPCWLFLKTKEVQTRKFSPVLESEILSGNGILPSNEWKTVPDIWRTSAEKYGDRVALVDPYHDPPTNMTYKQVSLGSLFLYIFYQLNISGVCSYMFWSSDIHHFCVPWITMERTSLWYFSIFYLLLKPKKALLECQKQCAWANHCLSCNVLHWKHFDWTTSAKTKL